MARAQVSGLVTPRTIPELMVQAQVRESEIQPSTLGIMDPAQVSVSEIPLSTLARLVRVPVSELGILRSIRELSVQGPANALETLPFTIGTERQKDKNYSPRARV